jgi:hypothetical protein
MQRRYPVGENDPLRRVGTNSRRPSRSSCSPPDGGAPRGGAACGEFERRFRFLRGADPTDEQGRPGREVSVRLHPRVFPWMDFQPTSTVAIPRGRGGPGWWNSSPIFLVILSGGTLGCGRSFGNGKAFEPRWSAGDKQPRLSWWVSRPSGAVAYPRRVPRRSRLVLAGWCCFRVGSSGTRPTSVDRPPGLTTRHRSAA